MKYTHEHLANIQVLVMKLRLQGEVDAYRQTAMLINSTETMTLGIGFSM